MSTQDDLLTKPQPPDRVYYAFGMLLDEDDFRAEQTYHRGRLARLAAYLHGAGTVAGLEVGVEPDADETVRVSAGLAVDRLGRLIEVSRSACLRLTRWWDAQLADARGMDALANSFRSGGGSEPDGVVVDVFIKFVACERGKQPVFSATGFEALDAVSPSRLRDGYQLDLVIREEDPVPIPRRPFPDLSGMDEAAARQRVLEYKLREAWQESTAWSGPNETLVHESWQVSSQDGSELLLARLAIPCEAVTLRRDTSSPVRVDNALRQLVFSGAELAWLTQAWR